MKVYVEYSFIFDPSELWESMTMANDDLRAYFLQKGFEAEIVENSSQDTRTYSNKIMIYLSKKELSPLAPPVSKPQTMGALLKPLRQKKDFQGKFVKENSPI